MLSAAEVSDQLQLAGSAWSTVRGRSRWWRRRDLVLQAFTAAFEEQASWGGGMGSAVTATRPAALGDPPDDVEESTLAVAVQRVPWRLRVELLTAYGLAVPTEVLIVDGSTFWARRVGADTTTNGENPHVSHGGGEIVQLLDPGAVPGLFDLTVTGVDRVAGRDCTAVTAQRRPGPGLHGSWPEPPFAMISGGTRFRLSVDAELGILLRVVKVVDGVDAEITEFTDLTVDPVLPAALFAPLPDARTLP